MSTVEEPVLQVRGLDIGYKDVVVVKDLTFDVIKKNIFVVMGVSGCGKSTLLKTMIGLLEPIKGQVLFGGKDFFAEDEIGQRAIMRKFGVLYQGSALWSSLTLEENIALVLELYSGKSAKEIHDLVLVKLALVGLEGHEEMYPSELSGGMRKRAGLARAIALDPEIIFLDEPSSGLDPINARMLDELILKLRDTLGATIVIVTHELASIFAVSNNSVFLDDETKTMIAQGDPKKMLTDSKDPKVIQFLTRGKKKDIQHEQKSK